MCYSIGYFKKKLDKYKDYYGVRDAIIENGNTVHWITAFQRPKIPVITDDKPDIIQMFEWGLIPFFSKDYEKSKKYNTYNARGEDMFSKPSYRQPAKSKHCAVLVDNFFENHHHQGEVYPFLIRHKDERPLTLGGIWDTWINKETGEMLNTVSIVTTPPNAMMRKIHNNPKASDGSRMPFILEKEQIPEYFDKNGGMEYNRNKTIEMIKPFDEKYLTAHTVKFIINKKGRDPGVGNSPEAREEFIHDQFDYRELLKPS
jgi:putative SOS response-associated peptidase YedK